jgi:hypothetical protein
MTPKEGDNTHTALESNEYRIHAPLFGTMSHQSTQQNHHDPIMTAVNDMEAKIIEKVSMLTLDPSNEAEEPKPTEVSFTSEDITDLTETPATTAPSMTTSTRSLGTTARMMLPSTSPIRPRAFKRTMTSISTSPLNDTEESTALQALSSILAPRPKRRRGTLADCPRLPLDSHDGTTLNQPQVSPFRIYDKRLDGLVERLTKPHEIPSWTSSPTEQEELNAARPTPSHHDRLSLPPVLSWMKPKRMARNRAHCVSVEGLPRQEPSALELLALELEASPILAMPVLLP